MNAGEWIPVADAVAKAINAERISCDFVIEAVRGYADFEVKLDEEEQLRIDVVLARIGPTELDSEEASHHVVSVDVGLRYKFGEDEAESNTGKIDPEILDELVVLTQTIVELFQDEDARELPAFKAATFKEAEVRTIAPGNYLRGNRQFLSIIRLSYDVSVVT